MAAKIERIELPEPAPQDFGVHDLPRHRWLVLADVHCPYHDLAALKAAVKWGRAERCDGVLVLGDLIDYYQLSRFNRDPRRSPVAQEMAAVKQVLRYVRQEIRPAAFVWKAGNHELRWDHYLNARAPELLGLPCASIEANLGLAELGVTYVRPTHYLTTGHLSIVHGHEWSRGLVNPVNPARGAFLRTLSCTLSAHEHRTSDHTERALDGRTITCWSLGCLCALHPEYAVLNRWNHGAAILDNRKDWRIDNRRIVNGEIM
jgi:hypothetical protein